MSVTFSTKDREELMNLLNDEQRGFVQEQLKRGRKTTFANVLAIDKGHYLPESATDEEITLLLDEWILEDYIDHQEVSSAHSCECGRPLRYQYIVRHLKTNEKRSFGINHFEEHTGLSPVIVKEIIKGFQKIDYELDEILFKLDNNWTLDEKYNDLPNELEIPEDIQQHLYIDLPLLDRQIQRLDRIVSEYQDKATYSEDLLRDENIEYETIEKEVLNETAFTTDQPVFDLFSDEVSPGIQLEEQRNSADYELSSRLKDAVVTYVEEGVESARLICELLIKNNNAPRNRYISNKPKIYCSVCLFLDSMVSTQELIIKSRDTVDRLYVKT